MGVNVVGAPAAIAPNIHSVTNGTAFTTASTTYVDITGITLTKTMVGKPTVTVFSTSESGNQTSAQANSTQLLEGATSIGVHSNAGSVAHGCNGMSWKYDSVAGSKVTKVQGKAAAGTATWNNNSLGSKTLIITEFAGST